MIADKIEYVAEELYLDDARKSYSRWASWKSASTNKQEIYRERATVALDAAERWISEAAPCSSPAPSGRID